MRHRLLTDVHACVYACMCAFTTSYKLLPLAAFAFQASSLSPETFLRHHIKHHSGWTEFQPELMVRCSFVQMSWRCFPIAFWCVAPGVLTLHRLPSFPRQRATIEQKTVGVPKDQVIPSMSYRMDPFRKLAPPTPPAPVVVNVDLGCVIVPPTTA